MSVQIYMYAGYWVADCPQMCGSTEHMMEGLTPSIKMPKKVFTCSYCKHTDVEIIWPESKLLAGIWQTMILRPIPHTRNWYPENHPAAIKFRIAHGQTIEDIRKENIENGVPAWDPLKR